MPVASRKHRSNRAWIQRHVTDPFVKRATAQGYRARSAFKLIEIDDKDRLLKPGITVLDLGAAPGSWSQVARQRLAGADGRLRGRIIALDVLPMDPVADVVFLQGDFREQETADRLVAALGGDKADLILSDLSPNLSGIAVADAARGLHLLELALEFALLQLKPGGTLLVKAFQGSGFSQFVAQLKKHFSSVDARKPAASRAESAETYLLARRFKGSPGEVDA
ncbi:MAG: RlmE family RNA methyltransferase [Burkholderiales bacterium]|jgi:23S rRNA (uridine2552-2'-O)-methyltransferase|nr:RlmE family RNA methyltransferase [Burkholderiales bacterium]